MPWGISLCGISVGLDLDDSKSGRRLKRYFRPFEDNGEAPAHIFTIRESSFLIDGEMKDPGLSDDLAVAWDRICFWINSFLYQEVKDYLLIHAGVARKDEKAYVFPGDSGKGKSTLIAWLLLNGWEFLSDHLAVISLESGRLFPYPMPIKLKDPPQKLIVPFLKERAFSIDSHRIDGGMIHYAACNAYDCFTGNPIASFIFPNRKKRCETRLEALSRRDLLSMLVPQCVNLFFQTREAYDLLFSLVEQIPGYELAYEDIEDLGDLMAILPQITGRE